MINIAICDDNAEDRSELVVRVELFGRQNSIGVEISEYESGRAFVEAYAWQYDIIILDIELDHVYGIDVARKIRERDEDVLILFATNYTDYAYDSFSTDPVGYIQKSESYEMFADVMKRIISRLNTKREKIVFTYDGVNRSVDIGKIEYLKYGDREVMARLSDGSYEKTKETMKHVLEEDRKHLFLPINRDVAVNLIWIEECNNGYVTMKASRKKFKISTRRKKSVEEAYLRYLRDRTVDIWK